MFTLSVKQMALNEVEKVEKKILAIDVNKNHIPDVYEAKQMVEDGVKKLEELESEITPDEMAKALNILFPGKFTADKIKAGEDAIAKIIGGVAKAAALGESIQEALKD